MTYFCNVCGTRTFPASPLTPESPQSCEQCVEGGHPIAEADGEEGGQAPGAPRLSRAERKAAAKAAAEAEAKAKAEAEAAAKTNDPEGVGAPGAN